MKYLQGSPTGSDRAGHRGVCPLHATDDSHEIRRVLAPSLVDRACSPMPEVSTQHLPLPDILMAVKHQLLEPWAAQHSLEAQQQKDAMLCLQALPAAGSEARSEADEALAAENTWSVGRPPMPEHNAGSTVHSPDATQLRMLDSIQLGQMNSTADLASSEASSEVEQKATESSPEPAAARALLCKDPSLDIDSYNVIAAQGVADTAAAEEEAANESEADPAAAEEASEKAEAIILRLPSEVDIAAATGGSPAADSEASIADSSDGPQQQPDWNQQWAQLQSKQHQQQHASARGKQPQPSKLMKALAAASVAEQSESISATFERYSRLAEPYALLPAATNMVGSKVTAGIGINSLSARQHVGPCSAESQSEYSSMAEHAGDPLHHEQVSLGYDARALADAQQAEQAQHAQQAQLPQQAQPVQHSQKNHARSGRQAEDSSAASKRSLVPAVKPDANDSSAETSPEAAKNSRMKMRRTSGEFQQVMPPFTVWLRVAAPIKETTQTHAVFLIMNLLLSVILPCHNP